jgi:hypothetical protein
MDPASINRLSERIGVPPINRSGKRKNIVHNFVHNTSYNVLGWSEGLYPPQSIMQKSAQVFPGGFWTIRGRAMGRRDLSGAHSSTLPV